MDWTNAIIAQMMPMNGLCWGCILGWSLAVGLAVVIVLAIVKLLRK